MEGAGHSANSVVLLQLSFKRNGGKTRVFEKLLQEHFFQLMGTTHSELLNHVFHGMQNCSKSIFSSENGVGVIAMGCFNGDDPLRVIKPCIPWDTFVNDKGLNKFMGNF